MLTTNNLPELLLRAPSIKEIEEKIEESRNFFEKENTDKEAAK